jgi:hypothetical protein
MDRWSNEQLTRMEKGGNLRAKEFFEQKFGGGNKTMTIVERVIFPPTPLEDERVDELVRFGCCVGL